MYKISINNLTFDAILGILKYERSTPQRIVIDIEIKYNYKEDNFIDYGEVANLTKRVITAKKFQLIEEALESLVTKIKREFPQSKEIKLKISKPDVLQKCIVGVEIKKNFKKN